MLAVGRALGEPGVVGRERRAVAARNLDREVAEEAVADDDVGEREVVARDEAAAREPRLEDVEGGVELPERRRELLRVPLRRRGADDRPEDRAGEVAGEGRLRPLCPHVDRPADDRVRGPEGRAAVAAREVAQDRAAFEHDEPAVADDGDEAVRVHGPKFRRVRAAKGMAVVEPLTGELQLADSPHHRLDVGRGGAAVDSDHQHSPARRWEREWTDCIRRPDRAGCRRRPSRARRRPGGRGAGRSRRRCRAGRCVGRRW